MYDNMDTNTLQWTLRLEHCGIWTRRRADISWWKRLALIERLQLLHLLLWKLCINKRNFRKKLEKFGATYGKDSIRWLTRRQTATQPRLQVLHTENSRAYNIQELTEGSCWTKLKKVLANQASWRGLLNIERKCFRTVSKCEGKILTEASCLVNPTRAPSRSASNFDFVPVKHD